MKKIVIALSLTILLFSTTSRLAKAAPEKNKFFQALVALETSINSAIADIHSELVQLSSDLASLAGKVEQNETAIGDLDTRVVQNTSDIGALDNDASLLEGRVATLEDEITPESTNIVFAENRPQPFNTDWINMEDYHHFVLSYEITDFIANYGIMYTDNPSTGDYVTQWYVQCGWTSTCPDTYVTVQAKYYRIGTGTANGNVTATAVAYK